MVRKCSEVFSEPSSYYHRDEIKTMIEIKMPEENETIIELPNGHKTTIKQNMVDLAIEAYNMGYKDGVEAYKAMMEIEKEEKEEPAEWIVDTDDTRRWDRVRFYCSSCNSWNTYGKSKYCPNCGRRMQSEGLQRENS